MAQSLSRSVRRELLVKLLDARRMADRESAPRTAQALLDLFEWIADLESFDG